MSVLQVKRKSGYGGRCFYLYGSDCQTYPAGYYSLPKLYELIKGGHEIEAENFSEVDLLLSCLKRVEPNPGDIKLLTRIIKNGGLVEYLNKLEKLDANYFDRY